MWTLKGFCLLAVVATVLCQTLPKDVRESGSNKTLTFKEIRQVMRDDDPTGTNHNIKVVISSHLALPNIKKWVLLLLKNLEETVSLVTNGDGSNPTSQTEFIFQGNLPNTIDSVFLIARNESNIVTYANIVAPLQDLRSEVAWVGNYEAGLSGSLRVTAGNELGEVQVGRDVCESADSPCYYITPKPRPHISDRCVEVAKDFQHCDDRVKEFKEPKSNPAMFVKNNKTLELEFTITKERFMVEVVAYDPLNHMRQFSGASPHCLFPMGMKWEDQVGKTMKCHHGISLPQGQEDMLVLVVKVDQDGKVLESSLLTYGGPPLPPQDSNTGVIVGAVFGTLIGLALIVLLVIFCMKKKDKKAAKTERGGSAVYTTTTTTDPAEA